MDQRVKAEGWVENDHISDIGPDATLLMCTKNVLVAKTVE